MKRLAFTLACTLACMCHAAVQMSPYDDAAYWFRGGIDSNGNGLLDHDTTEFRDVAHAALATDARHKCKLQKTDAGFGHALACEGKVVRPYAGNVLTNAPYLHLEQPFVTNGTVTVEGKTYAYGKLWANYLNLPNLCSQLPSGVNCTNYTFFIRFRDRAKVSEKQSEHLLAGLGFNWGVRCGVSISINTPSGSNTWHPKVYCGQEQHDIANLTFRKGQWCDLALSVRGKTVTAFACANIADTSVTNAIFAASTFSVGASDNPHIKSDQRSMRIGGEEVGTSGVFTNGLNGTHNVSGISNKVKAFCGDVQSIAFWTRALSTNEIERVMSERRPALVQMGLANGSSDEFVKTADSIDAGASRPENWNPILNDSHKTLTVSFNIKLGEDDVPQYLRLRPVPGSAAATVAFAIDGREFATRTVGPDADTLVYVKGSLLTKGTHTLTFTRTDANGGDFEIDAFNLAGSWRIGTGGEWGGMSHESNYAYQYMNRVFPLTDGNLDHFARGFSGGDNKTHTIPFDVPEDLVGKMHDATLAIYFSTSGTLPQSFDVMFNGTKLSSFSVSKHYDLRTVTVPAASILPGLNTLVITQNETGKWFNCSLYSLSLGRPYVGGLMIVR